MSTQPLPTRIIGISPQQLLPSHPNYPSNIQKNPNNSETYLTNKLRHDIPNLKAVLNGSHIDIFYLSGRHQSALAVLDELVLVHSLVANGGILAIGEFFR